MAHAENSTTIKQPPAKIYAFLADGTNNPQWRLGVTDITLASGAAGQVGAVYKQGIAGPGGRRVDGDYRISAAEPVTKLAFEVVAGPARPTGVYTLAPAEHDATTVTFTLDFQPRGLMKLMGPMIQKQMQQEVSCLAELKAVLEAPSVVTG